MTDNKEKMSEKGIDIRLWIVSIIAVMSVGFGLGKVSTAPPNASSTITTSTSSASSASSFSPHHMIYDMKNVDKQFLQSPDQLQAAITKTMAALDLELISSGCHLSEETSSYSCLLVMEEGQGAIQAFPDNGVLTIDLALNHPNHNNNKSMIQAADILKEHFEVGDDVVAIWTIDLRGQPETKKIMANHATMGSPIYIEKKLLHSANTKHNHKVDIWQTKSADGKVEYEDTLKYNLQPDDPRWLTNELSPIDVDVYVDGNFVVSSDKEEEMDAELDVHPVMFAHPNPKRVSIVSIVGDEGPNLQQVLRHDIESVTVFQPDEELVNIVKTYLPQAFDCSKMDGIVDDCLADKLVNWTKEAGSKWFPANYGSENSEAAFDVVLAEAITPEIAELLAGYVESIIQSLSSNGVLGINLGAAPTILHPRLEYGYFEKHEQLIQTLEGLSDVEAIILYDDDFSLNDEGAEVAPTAWLIACKSAVSCRNEFYASPEVMDSKIEARIVRAKNGHKLPIYFDGVVSHRLQSLPKSFETIYCRRDPVPFECNYRNLDFSRQVFDYYNSHQSEQEGGSSAFEIQKTEDGVQSTVIATVDIPSGSYIMPNEVSKSVVIDSSVLEEVQGSGGEPSCTAEGGSIVEIGPSNLIRSSENEEETNVGKWVPSHPSGGQRPKYSPVYDSHGHSFDVFLVATRDIAKGEELVRYSSKTTSS